MNGASAAGAITSLQQAQREMDISNEDVQQMVQKAGEASQQKAEDRIAEAENEMRQKSMGAPQEMRQQR